MRTRTMKAIAVALGVAGLVSGCGGGGSSGSSDSGTSSSPSRIQSLTGQPGPLDPVQEDVVKIGDQLAALAPNDQVGSFALQMSAALAQLLDGPDQMTVALENIGQIVNKSGSTLSSTDQSRIQAQLTQGTESMVGPTEDSAQSMLSAVVSLLGSAPQSGSLGTSYSGLKSSLNTLETDASGSSPTVSQILNDILSVLSNGQSLMASLNVALGGGSGAGSLPGLGSLSGPLQTLVKAVSGVQGGSLSLTSVINLMTGTSPDISSMPSVMTGLLNQLDSNLGVLPGQLSGSPVNTVSDLVSNVSASISGLIGNASNGTSGTSTLGGLSNLFAPVSSTLDGLVRGVLSGILHL